MTRLPCFVSHSSQRALRRIGGHECNPCQCTPSCPTAYHPQHRWLLSWRNWTSLFSRRAADSSTASPSSPSNSHTNTKPFDTVSAASTSSSSSCSFNKNTSAPLSAVRAHHDKLLATCLDLLDASADTAEQDHICHLVHLLLGSNRHVDRVATPAELFDQVYDALCLPLSRSHPRIQRGLRAVLASVVPARLYDVLTSADLFFPAATASSRWLHAPPCDAAAHETPHPSESNIRNEEDEEEEEKLLCRAVVLRLAHALLGQLDTSSAAQEALSEEEILAVYLEDFERCFLVEGATNKERRSDSLVRAFAALRDSASETMIRAKLATTLVRLCAAFDKDKTGRIDVAELKETATRVMGSAGATELLCGLAGDEQGKIRYDQFFTILTQRSE